MRSSLKVYRFKKPESNGKTIYGIVNGHLETTYSLRNIGDGRRASDRWEQVIHRDFLSAVDRNEVDFIAFSPTAAREILCSRSGLGKYVVVRNAAKAEDDRIRSGVASTTR